MAENWEDIQQTDVIPYTPGSEISVTQAVMLGLSHMEGHTEVKINEVVYCQTTSVFSWFSYCSVVKLGPDCSLSHLACISSYLPSRDPLEIPIHYVSIRICP